MNRQLSFALGLGALFSATVFAEAPAEVPSILVNPQATCASYEKYAQACAAQGDRLTKLASKTKYKLFDKDIEPGVRSSAEALVIFEGCTQYYARQIELQKAVTEDLQALLQAEQKCMDLTWRNYGMRPDTLQAMVGPRNKLYADYSAMHQLVVGLLRRSAELLVKKDPVEAKKAEQAAQVIEEEDAQQAGAAGQGAIVLEDMPKTSSKGAKSAHGKSPRNIPGFNSAGDALKTALGLGTLGAGLGMGIGDLMKLANSNSLTPLVNPIAAAAPAATGDTSTEAASGGGVGSTNPSVADSRLVRLTAQVTEYADGRRVVDGETTDKLKSSGAAGGDEARGDNSGRSSNDTSASSTLSSQSNGTALASGQTRAAVRALSSDSSSRQTYVDEQRNEGVSETPQHAK